MITLPTEYGEVKISNEVVAKMAGIASLECYGIVGMASQKQVKDGIAELLGLNNLEKGIMIKESETGDIKVEIHVIVAFGTRISEVASSVQNKVKYELKKAIGIDVTEVEIYVQGVRTIDSPK